MSRWTYAILVLSVIGAAWFVRQRDAGEIAAGLAWPIVGVVCAAGAVGVLLTRRAGVPKMWERDVRQRDRFVIPAAAGAAFGLITALHASLSGHRDAHPLPVLTAIVLFAAGGFLVEAFFRLFWITAITAATAAFRPAWSRRAFWIVATLVALYEPLPYVISAMHGDQLLSSVLVAVRLFAFNIAAAYFYRRAGFLAALSLRWGEYAVWHVVGQSVFGLR